MSNAVFAKAGTFKFTPTVGDEAEAIEPYELVTARLYADSPTDAQRADTGNTSPGDALQSITSWTTGDSAAERLIAYAAISDPDPTDTGHEIYYWVISYRLEASGTIINDVEPVVVQRVEGVQSGFDVHPDDVYAIEGKLKPLLDAKMPTKISIAETLVRKKLRGMGFDLQRLELEDAKQLVVFKALVISCRGLSNEPGDEWWMKKEDYDGDYKDLLDALPLGYDLDDDGDKEPGEVSQQKYASGYQFM